MQDTARQGYTHSRPVYTVSPFYPFILLFSPHLFLPKWPRSLPLVPPLNVSQRHALNPCIPCPPPPARGASPPLMCADRGHPWPTGQWLPQTALGRLGLISGSGLLGLPHLTASLCSFACTDQPSQVGCSPVMGLVVARSGHHPGSPPTHRCASELLGACRRRQAPQPHHLTCTTALGLLHHST